MSALLESASARLLERPADATPTWSAPHDGPGAPDVRGAIGRALIDGGIACVVRESDERDARDEGVGGRETRTRVLVAPCDRSRVDAALRAQGFVRTMRDEWAGTQCYRAFDASTGGWSCATVATAPWYATSARPLQGDWGPAMVARARAGAAALPDEFLDLLLRAILDDGAFSAAARERLRMLRARLLASPAALLEAAEAVQGALGTTLRWGEIGRAIDADDWAALLASRAAIRRRLFWRAPATHLLCWARRARWLRPRGRAGLVVALLGPDGAGKTTLAEALVAERPLRARRIYLGTNQVAGDALALHRWMVELRRRAGTRPLGRLVLPLLRASGFVTHLAEQRYRHALALRHRAAGGVVVFDRCALDAEVNAALQRTPRTWRRRVRDGLLHGGEPRPDVVVVLDAPGAVLYARKREHSPERLETMRQAYRSLRERHSAVVVVDAARDGASVRRAVTALLWARLGTRANPETDA